MTDIITNTLQIGNDNLILRDADAQEKVSDLKEDINNLGLSIVDGKLNITYEEVTA
jgi:hypothetical protein